MATLESLSEVTAHGKLTINQLITIACYVTERNYKGAGQKRCKVLASEAIQKAPVTVTGGKGRHHRRGVPHSAN